MSGEGGTSGFEGVDFAGGSLDFLRHDDLPGEVADELVEQGGLLTVAEAARAVGTTRVAVRHWIRRGLVVAVPDGKSWLVGEQSLWDCELARRSTPGWDEEARARRAGRGGGEHSPE